MGSLTRHAPRQIVYVCETMANRVLRFVQSPPGVFHMSVFKQVNPCRIRLLGYCQLGLSLALAVLWDDGSDSDRM